MIKIMVCFNFKNNILIKHSFPWVKKVIFTNYLKIQLFLIRPITVMIKATISIIVNGSRVDKIWSQLSPKDCKEAFNIKFKKIIIPHIPTPRVVSVLFIISFTLNIFQ